MQPHLPSGWDELTWEQLREVHRILAEPVEKSVRNLNLYLYLTGLEIAEGEGEVNDGEVFYYLRQVKSEKLKVKSTGGMRNKVSKLYAHCKSLFTFHFSLFTSRSDLEFFSVKADDLALYLNGCHIEAPSDSPKGEGSGVSEKLRQRVERAGALDWVDQPVGKDGQGGLMGLPEEEIVIGKKTFLLPAMLITNLTYEQYSNLQKLQQAVWSYTEQVQGLQKELTPLLTSPEGEGLPDQDGLAAKVKEIEEAMREVRKYRMQFLAHALLEKEVDRRGVVVSEYKSNVAEVMAPYMEKHAPEWLFDILVQHMQSCLGMYKTQFPELFSKDGGKGRDVIPLVSEVETINAIQKWQGYQEQQKVYDTNAVFVFGILNSMTKEAKAIEEANAKMKSHRK